MNAPTVTVAALVLAAGKASRMRDHGHKLLATFDGIPLVRQTVAMAVASMSSSVTIVTGHSHNDVEDCVAGMGVHIVYNPNFAVGISSSLKAGISEARVQAANGVIVLLADMPEVNTRQVNKLITLFRKQRGNSIIRAVSGTTPGHPVILPSTLFDRIGKLKGDFGARQIINSSELNIIDVDIGNAAIHDVDTPDALRAAGGLLDGEVNEYKP